MWLMNYITNHSMTSPEAAKGETNTGGAGGTAVASSSEHKALEMCFPYGIFSVAPSGERAVVLPLEDGEVALGVTDNSQNIEVGELALFSQGGASIILKNNGDVVINGQVFARE